MVCLADVTECIFIGLVWTQSIQHCFTSDVCTQFFIWFGLDLPTTLSEGGRRGRKNRAPVLPAAGSAPWRAPLLSALPFASSVLFLYTYKVSLRVMLGSGGWWAHSFVGLAAWIGSHNWMVVYRYEKTALPSHQYLPMFGAHILHLSDYQN